MCRHMHFRIEFVAQKGFENPWSGTLPMITPLQIGFCDRTWTDLKSNLRKHVNLYIITCAK